jgi:hypothetical protein
VIMGVPQVIDQGRPVAFDTGAPYLNPAAFRQVPTTANNVPLRLGTAPRYLPNIRGPQISGESFGILKRFISAKTEPWRFGAISPTPLTGLAAEIRWVTLLVLCSAGSPARLTGLATFSWRCALTLSCRAESFSQRPHRRSQENDIL